MIHFIDIEGKNLKVGDNISGELFVYQGQLVVKFGYVQPGSVSKIE